MVQLRVHNMRRVAIIFLLGILVLQACKEGCTNDIALNYDSKAKSDDGSCMYCDSSWQVFSGTFSNIQDFEQGSPYYMNTVVQISARSYKLLGVGNACSQFLNTDCNTFQHEADIANIIGRDFIINGDLVISYTLDDGSSKQLVRVLEDYNVPSNSVRNTGLILPTCLTSQGTAFNVYLRNYVITYP